MLPRLSILMLAFIFPTIDHLLDSYTSRSRSTTKFVSSFQHLSPFLSLFRRNPLSVPIALLRKVPLLPPHWVYRRRWYHSKFFSCDWNGHRDEAKKSDISDEVYHFVWKFLVLILGFTPCQMLASERRDWPRKGPPMEIRHSGRWLLLVKF
ncbi:hypothetical protein M413DRAFT_448907 [Hebeloma cylindrosporum]|uniref:Uncharacterized protein n=1 Tax=Hebeloma cylindrosporum TaxID=76867 RepID=A0A0C3BXI6_HEBCY|nr:hypothetical protein M413DRAFT_448907 [Hebeloma cylindrosporum h7]